MTTYYTFSLGAWLVRMVAKRLFNIRLEVVLGTFIYGLYLVMRRLAIASYSIVRSVNYKPTFPERPAKPTSILAINSYYRLSGLKVMLGDIKVDLDTYHTIIVGATGTGKTNVINGVLIQLFSQNSEFTSKYDVYLLDLKGNEDDCLHLWRPMLAGYFGISDDENSAEATINALDQISRTIYSDKSDKRKLVIIDEVEQLTRNASNSAMRRKGEEAVERLARQLRAKGALAIATQRPHYQSIPRAVTANTGRKICFRIDRQEDTRLAMGYYAHTDVTNLRNGEFVIYEPGRRFQKERVSRTLLVNLPEDVQTVIDRHIEISSEDDIRLRLFKETCQGLSLNAQLPGINKITPGFDGLTNKDIEAHRRNWALAGAIYPKMRANGSVSGYYLTREYEEAFGLIVAYIKEAKWKENPEPITK